MDNYQDYSLNFIDTKMRFIIQEQNNPLKYDFDEFPFLTYYSLQSKPNRDDIIEKINNNNNINYLILNKFFNSSPKSSVKTRELQKFSLYNLGKYFVNSINGQLILNINEIEKYQKLFELFKSQLYESNLYEISKYFEGSIDSISVKKKLNTIIDYEKIFSEKINEINNTLENLINENIKNDPSYKYLFNEIYEEKEFFNSFDFEIINLNLNEISKYKHYANMFSNYIYRDNIKSNHDVDYFNYKKFNIHLTELDEHLFSILLYNKKILLDIDYSKNFFIPRFDLFNKLSNNQLFLKNYLFEYPTREELTEEQKNNINDSLQKIIESFNIKIIEDKNMLVENIKDKIEKIQKEIEERKKALDGIFKKENKKEEKKEEENKEKENKKEEKKEKENKEEENKEEEKEKEKPKVKRKNKKKQGIGWKKVKKKKK